jgi:APA family basic amino acid/polyamine antiporter
VAWAGEARCPAAAAPAPLAPANLLQRREGSARRLAPLALCGSHSVYAARTLSPRRLGLLDVLAIGVNAIVGSGVFSLPDDMRREMGALSPLAFVLCALLLAPVAACFAELAGRTDDTGGPYVYATRAFGTTAGFVVGWSCWLNAFLSWAANTTLLVELAGAKNPLVAKLAAVSVVVVLGAINYAGVRPGSAVVKLVVAGKLLAILCFVAAGLFAFDPSRFDATLPHGMAGVGTGVYLALFPLQGFEVVPVPAGETRQPRRAVPVGLLGSLALSAVLFVVVQIVLVGSYPGLASESVTPLVDAARHLSPTLGMIVFVGSLVSIGGFTAGSALGSPRYAYAIACAGQLPRALARLHDRFQTPHVAIVVTTALTAALAVAFDYRTLVGFSNVTVVFQYAVTCLAVPILRRKDPMPDGRFKVPGGPWLIPITGAIGSVALLGGASGEEFAYAGAGILLGFLVLAAVRVREPRT